MGIELVGATVNRDAFGAIVERENAANAATVGGDNQAKGNLSIVEVEIYGDEEKVAADFSAIEMQIAKMPVSAAN